jgi:hypothetical protein
MPESSWPASSQPSTQRRCNFCSSLQIGPAYASVTYSVLVDGRVKPGHDIGYRQTPIARRQNLEVNAEGYALGCAER